MKFESRSYTMAKPIKKAAKKGAKKAVKKTTKNTTKKNSKKSPTQKSSLGQIRPAKKISHKPTANKTKPAPKMNSNPSKNTYSKSAQELTLRILDDMPVSSFFRGYCVLKYSGNEYSHGRILLTDAMNYNAIVRDMDSDKVLVTYDSFKDMVEDGWVVD